MPEEVPFYNFLDSRPPNKERAEENLTNDVSFLILNRFGGYENIFSSLEEAKKFYPTATPGSSKKYKFLLSEEIKFFPNINLRFYHLILESIPSVLYEIEYQKSLGKNISIIMSPIEYRYKGHDKNLKFIIDFFTSSVKNLNVNIETIPMPEFETVNEESFMLLPVRNIYFIKNKDWHTMYSLRLGRDLYTKIITGPKALPNRTVFLSREDSFDTNQVTLEELEYLNTKKYIDYPKNYLRIDNENKVVQELEKFTQIDYTQSKDFKSFQHQVSFFNETKVLISPTGSGLANCIFMQPGTLVIELLTPLVIGEINNDSYAQLIENHYSSLAAVFGINYIAIPHDRSASTIVKKLQQLGIGNLINNFNPETVIDELDTPVEHNLSLK